MSSSNFTELPPDLESEGYLLDIKMHEDSDKILFYLYFAGTTNRFYVKEQFYPSLLLKSRNVQILSEILMRKFPSIYNTQIVYKTDPSSNNYLNKPASKFLRLSFENTAEFKIVLNDLQNMIRKKEMYNEKNIVKIHKYDFEFSNDAGKEMIKHFSEPDDVKQTQSIYSLDSQKYMIQHNRDEILTEKDIFDVFHDISNTATTSLASLIDSIWEYDIMYEVRYMCERDIRCGKNYLIKRNDMGIQMQKRDLSLPPNLSILAFDIEVTKDPLKFPVAAKDKVIMISMMGTNVSKLLINQELVGHDVRDFSYCVENLNTECFFEVEMCVDEKFTLARFMNICQDENIDILTTYNGSSFDLPFLLKRIELNGLSENITTFLHLDCYLWVKRDSYLPMGSQGLKSACKAKLGYDPEEIDPEEMMWYCEHDPQRMAVYAVSDAYATFMLYSKYVHPFIFSLCTLIPLNPENVLSKGSGTLCESLLISEAFSSNILVPNIKQCDEYFFKGKICEEVNYVGGHVESLRCGIFRDDFDVDFTLNTETVDFVIENISNIIDLSYKLEAAQKEQLAANVIAELRAYVEKTRKMVDGLHLSQSTNKINNMELLHTSKESVSCKNDLNKDTHFKDSTHDGLEKYVRTTEEHKLTHIKITDKPHIYHMDVSAMYPNIILTNRLQPISVIQSDRCIKCDYYSQKRLCQRKMPWMMRVQYFLPKKSEILAIKRKLRSEKFTAAELKKLGCVGLNLNSKYTFPKGCLDKAANSTLPFSSDTNDGYFKNKTTMPVLSNWSGINHYPHISSKRFASETYIMKKKLKSDFAKAHVFFDPQSGTFTSDTVPQQSSDSAEILFSNLRKSDQKKILNKRIQLYSREAYKKIHKTEVIEMENIVCQRDEPFYVDVVRNFRDKRYEYKEKYKKITQISNYIDDLISKIAQNSKRCVRTPLTSIERKLNVNGFSHKDSNNAFDACLTATKYSAKPQESIDLRCDPSVQNFNNNCENLLKFGSKEVETSMFNTEICEKILKMVDEHLNFSLITDFVKNKCDVSAENSFSHLLFTSQQLKKQKIIFESLQVAHKCILNSFYGYVMRKGARWYSMEMGAIVCHTGSQIIKRAKDFIETIGLTLELDTDGIWCMIPKRFPNAFKLADGKNFSLVLSTLNFIINQEFMNSQYLEKTSSIKIEKKKLSDGLPYSAAAEKIFPIEKSDSGDVRNKFSHATAEIFLSSNIPSVNTYEQKCVNTITFEQDGPYKAMIIPASVEEGRLIKKKYVVIDTNDKICELKGFETKRRGELSVIKRFQEELFQLYTCGNTLRECYDIIIKHCAYWLALVENKGRCLSNNDIFTLFSESKNMSKPHGEYMGRKSTATCTALRLSEILGSEILTESGLKCQYVIARYPLDSPTSDRAIPVDVFSVPEDKRNLLLKKWLKCDITDLKTIMDWSYYKERLESVIVKLVVLPSILQGMGNYFPRIEIPEWAKASKQHRLDVFMKPISHISDARRQPKIQSSHMDLEGFSRPSLNISETALNHGNLTKNLPKQPEEIHQDSEKLYAEIENVEDNQQTHKLHPIVGKFPIFASKTEKNSATTHNTLVSYIEKVKNFWTKHFKTLQIHLICESSRTSSTEIYKGKLRKTDRKNKLYIYIKSSNSFNITNITILNHEVQCAFHNKGQEFIRDFLERNNTQNHKFSDQNDYNNDASARKNLLQDITTDNLVSISAKDPKNQSDCNIYILKDTVQNSTNNICTLEGCKSSESSVFTSDTTFGCIHVQSLSQNRVSCAGCMVSKLFAALNSELCLEMTCSIEKLRTKGELAMFLILCVDEISFKNNYSEFSKNLENRGICFYSISNKFSEHTSGFPDYLHPILILPRLLQNELVFFLCKGRKAIVLCEKEVKKYKNVMLQSLSHFVKDNFTRSSIFFTYKTSQNLKFLKDMLDGQRHFLCIIDDFDDHFTFGKNNHLDDVVVDIRKLNSKILSIQSAVQLTDYSVQKAAKMSPKLILDALVRKDLNYNNVLDLNCFSSEYHGAFCRFQQGYYENFCLLIHVPHTLIISIVESKTLLIEEQPSFLESPEFIIFQNFCKRILLKASSIDTDADLYNCLLDNFNNWCLTSVVLPSDFKKSLIILHKRFLSYFYYKVSALGVNFVYCNSDVMCIDTSKSRKVDVADFLSYIQEQIRHISGLEMLELRVLRIYEKFAFHNLHNYFYLDMHQKIGAVSETKVQRTFLQMFLRNCLDRSFFYDLVLKKKCRDIEAIKTMLSLVKMVYNVDDVIKTCSTVLKYDFDEESNVEKVFSDIFCEQCSGIYKFCKIEKQFNRCLICLQVPSATTASVMDELINASTSGFFKCSECSSEPVKKLIKNCFCGEDFKIYAKNFQSK